MNSPKTDAAEDMQQLLSNAQHPTDTEGSGFELAGERRSPARIIELLQPHMKERRFARLRKVVAARTYAIVPVVEGLVNVGNVSAVMRSAEALGCQRFHVVTSGAAKFKQSERTSRGAEKWLDLWRWHAPDACADHLKERGYTLVAMHLADEAVPISKIDFTKKTALVFGNERDGVSEAMLREADRCCMVPLSGFTESFNVSVAAAVALYHAREDRLRRQGFHADLTAEEQERLLARFCLRSVPNAEDILKRKLKEEA